MILDGIVEFLLTKGCYKGNTNDAYCHKYGLFDDRTIGSMFTFAHPTTDNIRIIKLNGYRGSAIIKSYNHGIQIYGIRASNLRFKHYNIEYETLADPDSLLLIWKYVRRFFIKPRESLRGGMSD